MYRFNAEGPGQSLYTPTTIGVMNLCVGSNGHAQFFDLEPGVYVLRVVATNQVPDRELIRRTFEIYNDPKHCSTHLINNGVTVVGNNARVELAGSGQAKGYKYNLDRNDFYPCKLRSE